MPWITPTDTDLLAPTAKERVSIATIKGQDDLAAIVAEVVDLFRGAILGRTADIGPDGTVPTSLKTYTLALAWWLFISRGVPQNDAIQTKPRKDAADAAERVLQSIRDGTFAVEPYSTTASGNWNSERKVIGRAFPVPKPSTQWQGTETGYANPSGPTNT